jgi:ubiquinone/menaquinone biosynthesis C-methylase UbiE
VLDSGCGGGGTALSIAEESSLAIGLDLDGRFVGSGTRLAAEKGIARAGFVQGNGQSLPFRDGAFDLVLSHSVIEHVLDARAYLAECHRVLRPGGCLYLSTAPSCRWLERTFPRCWCRCRCTCCSAAGWPSARSALSRATRPGRCASARRRTPSSRWRPRGSRRRTTSTSG